MSRSVIDVYVAAVEQLTRQRRYAGKYWNRTLSTVVFINWTNHCNVLAVEKPQPSLTIGFIDWGRVTFSELPSKKMAKQC
jgi:hypothetical protein